MCKTEGDISTRSDLEPRPCSRRLDTAKVRSRRQAKRAARVQERGFTLIELANVIMIISVLAIIGLPAITDGHAAVKRTSCCERQRHIFEAALLYAAENFVGDGEVNVTALIPDYVHRDVAECPESASPDYDDYTVIFEDGRPMDVVCDIEGDAHAWASH